MNYVDENDAYQCLREYLLMGSGEIHYYGNGVSAHKFAKMLQSGQYYGGDAPDMLIQKDGEAIIVEHFRFDSYHQRRKGGSPGNREMERIHQRENVVHTMGEASFFHDEIDVVSTYDDYLKNVTNSFKKHYAHVCMYRETIRKLNLTNILADPKILFLIEDTTMLGARAIARSETFDASKYVITLAQCKPFLDLLKESIDVDYVLACSADERRAHNWFIDRNEIDAYYAHVVDFENMDFVSFKPQVISFTS